MLLELEITLLNSDSYTNIGIGRDGKIPELWSAAFEDPLYFQVMG